MAIIAKKLNEGNFELPPKGTFQAVVFAIYDGGMQPDKFNPGEFVHKIKIGIELNKEYTVGQYSGERITRYPEYTLSLSEKSNLLPVVESILNRPLTEEEKEGFDLEKLVGYNCQVTIMHKVSKSSGHEYADTIIGALMHGISEMEPKLKSDYLPKHIIEWQAKGKSNIEGEKILSKVTMYNKIKENIKNDSVKSKEFLDEWLKAGGTLDKISEEKMSKFYYMYGM